MNLLDQCIEDAGTPATPAEARFFDEGVALLRDCLKAYDTDLDDIAQARAALAGMMAVSAVMERDGTPQPNELTGMEYVLSQWLRRRHSPAGGD
ncbi:MAG TPA: hypothetical protein VG276_28245 [Actinomycetes bacterium]|jgi:hypothetical protein|nr:hypothetical protein [Actinomycetes bacterium]